MAQLRTHLRKAEEFEAAARSVSAPSVQVELLFLSAYHWIESVAALERTHIMKHQRVPEEIRRNPTLFGESSEAMARAFSFLDNTARSKFVYGDSGTKEELDEVLRSFEVVKRACRARLP